VTPADLAAIRARLAGPNEAAGWEGWPTAAVLVTLASTRSDVAELLDEVARLAAIVDAAPQRSSSEDTVPAQPLRVEMVDPLGQIVRECANKALTQRSVAMTYAFAIRQESPTDPRWRVANEALVARWGERGRDQVKGMAWKLVNGGTRG
jgi:hypothetical protein